MMFKTPAFWYPQTQDTDGTMWLEKCLSPFSYIYWAGHILHQRLHRKPHETDAFTICIGNVVAGGSGKTPTAIALNTLIQGLGKDIDSCFLTRGYGGKTLGPIFVSDIQDRTQSADEALLLGKHADTIISADRVLGVKYADEKLYDVIIMDDGHQNPTVRKDLSFVVISEETGFGNKRMLPAGPLREPLEEGLLRADAFIVVHNGTQPNDQSDVYRQLPQNKPVFTAHLTATHAAEKIEKDRQYIAFSGIAHPYKFYRTLDDNGFDVVATHDFPDHHRYSTDEIEKLISEAEQKSAALITTEKDAAKIADHLLETGDIHVLPVEITWDKPQDVQQFLKEKIHKRHEKT